MGRRDPRAGGFTLIELLVVIAITGTLMGMLLPALGSARTLARQTQARAGLREMLNGYAGHQLDHAGAVLYGYTPATIEGQAVTVRTTSGHVLGLPVADRYPWRLAPYVGHLWEILYCHADLPPLPQPGDSEREAMLKAYTLSLSPTFGINSIYVGGHGDGPFRGFVTTRGVTRPNRGRHVVFHSGEVRQPSQLIVFAETQAHGGLFGDEGGEGLHFVTPPCANGRRWQVRGGDLESLMPGHIAGLPRGRWGIGAVTGFFDGHVTAMTPRDLDDMRLWANRADGPEYDFQH